MLAEKLLVNQVNDPAKIKQIIDFLCSDSGSHDYTINRREAKNSLGLNVDKPDTDTYNVIKAIYDDISAELGFGLGFDPIALAKTQDGTYSIRRALIESVTGGCDFFETSGKVNIIEIPDPSGLPSQQGLHDERIFEGWKHEDEEFSEPTNEQQYRI